MSVSLASLNPTSFHSLVNDLVKTNYPEATCLEGKGGDDEIDCYDGDLDSNGLHVFQHKFLPNTLSNSGKGQINKSLTTLLKKHIYLGRQQQLL